MQYETCGNISEKSYIIGCCAVVNAIYVTRFTTIEKMNKSCQIISRLTRKSIL